MHIHLPKPLHGWRQFLNEYAIIVLGVLTALALDQLVEAAHERRLAREATAAINQELQDDLNRVASRQRQQACVLKRIDEIQALLTDWRDDNAFPAGLHVGFPGDVGVADQRWQANLASGRFSEEPPDQQADQAGLYTLVHVIGSVESKEIESWAKLRALELGSRALSTGSKPIIAEAVADARNDAESLNGLMGALLNYLRPAGPGRPGMTPSKDYDAAFPGTACQPMRAAARS
jgi:type II secretory pathway pseudopilin PulG